MSGHSGSPHLAGSSTEDSETAYTAPTTHDHDVRQTTLGAWEIEDNGRPPFILSLAEYKLLAIAGVRPVFNIISRSLLMVSSGWIFPGWYALNLYMPNVIVADGYL